ncbi:MAG TPA: hypothetical protein VF989_11550 [Polyangiaceae bacterium]
MAFRSTFILRSIATAGQLGIALALAGCQKQPSEPPPALAPTPLEPVAPIEGAPAPEAKAAEPAPAPKPSTVMIADVGFKTPESIFYDSEQDVYLVSNINGSPLEANNNGFISKVAPDGKVIELKWIESGKNGVTLNAPKGMAISGGLLYISDITFVRLFDRKTGEPKGKIGIGGATFLNDVAAAPDGTVYVSDSGLKAGKDGLAPTGTDAVFKISNGQAQKVVLDKGLGGPNGLTADDAGVWVVTFGKNELFKVDKEGKRADVGTLPKGGLDGLVRLSDGSFLVSSWEASTVYRGKPGGPFEAIVTDVASPADIGFDSSRGRLLIPLFQKDAMAMVDLPDAPKTANAAAAPSKPDPKAAVPADPKKAAPAEGKPAGTPPAPAPKADASKAQSQPPAK